MSTKVHKSKGVDIQRRKILTGATGVVGAAGATFLAVPFVSSWQPSEKAKAAGAPVDVDISQLQPGQMLTVSWRGKPVWVVRRTPEMLEKLPILDAQLRDPASQQSEQPVYCQNETRAINPEYLVVVGICTHLGCAPLYRPAIGSPDVGADWQGGFFCPCHGSRFDLAGRVFQSVPAPTNLEIPPHHFMTEHLIRIGEDPQKEGVA
ncbi:ubiquinol-cytochrome c reductase iron-sulfur subunit [Thiomicrorhabdus sp. ZW0627]|uniref:ubiquinol-cytochrome c reductase iron-sulfur subunit n=1 Tax=Thiomicrorhabdus sp. ZW0627 TaxID=3039774 RepID=UPI0024373A67|nr:ubiquinol-cytochrome c reductase iron-sulfur subunit [Thiomicrorhabdus sp. ZW0627]MDG6773565.1 ubiquinol-cytochrome c reductase iron-sulfur subunit [Thiomicrorhabdus sp. ZW0627]